MKGAEDMYEVLHIGVTNWGGGGGGGGGGVGVCSPM